MLKGFGEQIQKRGCEKSAHRKRHQMRGKFPDPFGLDQQYRSASKRENAGNQTTKQNPK